GVGVVRGGRVQGPSAATVPLRRTSPLRRRLSWPGQRWLRQILQRLQPAIESGVPFVVLEPSCAAVFRDELSNFFPNDHDAQRLSRQTFLLSEFLEQKAPEFQLPRLERKALVHGHCHHKSIMGLEAEERI